MTRMILVPVDLSQEGSWDSLLKEAARQLAASPETEVTLLAVVPEIFGGLDWRYAIRGEMGGSEELDIDAMLKHSKERLAQIGDAGLPGDQPFEVIVRYGTVYEEVLKVAEELQPEVIIIGAHRPSLTDYLLGQNAARIVRHAKCTVQVVR